MTATKQSLTLTLQNTSKNAKPTLKYLPCTNFCSNQNSSSSRGGRGAEFWPSRTPQDFCLASHATGELCCLTHSMAASMATAPVQPQELLADAGLRFPTGICIDPSDESLVVCDGENGRVMRLSKQHQVTQIAAGLHWPYSVCTLGGDLFVAEESGHCVRRLFAQQVPLPCCSPPPPPRLYFLPSLPPFLPPFHRPSLPPFLLR